jgi:hypothetical protein
MSNLTKFLKRSRAVPAARWIPVSIPDAVQSRPARWQVAMLDGVRLGRFLLVLIVLLCASLSAHAQSGPWTSLIPTTRAVDWTQAGVTGGVPTTWTQCGSTIAAYGTSGSPASPSTIMNALSSCSGTSEYVLLGPGTFFLNGGMRNIGLNHVELRGTLNATTGALQTTIIFSAASTCQGGNGSCLVGFESSDTQQPTLPSPSTIYNWTAGYAKNATSITLSSGANITANSTWIWLDGCNTALISIACTGIETDNGNFFECGQIYSGLSLGCAGNGPDAGFARPGRFEVEVVQATACTPACGSSGPTVVTISPPLMHPNWASVVSPQAWLVQPMSFAGVRNLILNGAATTDTAGISFFNCSNCWAVGNAILHSYNIGIFLQQDIHTTIESNYVFDAGQALTYFDPTGIKYNGSNDLIDNNICQQISHVCTLKEGTSNGSVEAYNFAIAQTDASDFMFGAFWDHSTGDDYNLHEGNIGNSFDNDVTHGGHLMETYFRNFTTGWESCANNNCGGMTKDDNTTAYGGDAFSRYSNLIANVFGTPGFTNIYQNNNPNDYNGLGGLAILTGAGEGGESAAVPGDAVATSSMMRWGNYDVVNNAEMLCTAPHTPMAGCAFDERGDSAPSYPALSSPSTTFPPSFYLSSRPNWWPASVPFPAIGPDVTGGNVGQCTGTLNVAGQFGGAPALSSSQCTGTSFTSAWSGHVNAIPAMACYFAGGGTPDGSRGPITFNPGACYSGAVVSGSPPPPPPPPTAPNPPTGLIAVVQ